MSAMTYRVFVKGIEVYAYHGVSPAEQEIGHRFIIDADLRVAGNGHRSDDLAETVDYGAIAGTIVKYMKESRHQLMESLAQTIGERLLDSFELIQTATITVAKRLPPIPHVAESAGVSITVTRSDRLNSLDS